MAWDEPKHLSILCETAAADTFDHYFLQTRYPYYIFYFATNRKTSSIDNVQDKMIPLR